MTDETPADQRPPGAPQRLDAVVVGAGFGGMYAVHRLREMGLSVVGIEAGGDVGGVWYWNRYPGARCDLYSIDYSYAFSHDLDQEWTWSEQFAEQSEILAYAGFVAERLALRPHFRFNTRVVEARYDDARRLWVVRTDAGDVYEATFCVMATGPLSIPKGVPVEGADAFEGDIYLTAKWPHEPVSFEGKRVGLVGTGSTGIQAVPELAKTARELVVFQRTPSFTLPMRNVPLDPDYVSEIKRNYPVIRAAARNSPIGGVRTQSTRSLFSVTPAQRQVLMEDAWRTGGLDFLGLFSDVLTNPASNEVVADFVRAKIAEVVDDPAVAELLTPRGYPIFARRPCLDTFYYEAFNLPHVTLHDCRSDPIERLTPRGVQTASGEIAFDALIFATGYDALSGALLAFPVTGRDGVKLVDKWHDGPQSYLGMLIDGFPNLFVICGANSPAALANIIRLDEQNVDWMCGVIAHVRANGLGTLEAAPEAVDEWMDTVYALAEQTLLSKAQTWYTGANIRGKPRGLSMYSGGLQRYTRLCAELAEEGYRGLVFEREPEPV